MKRPIALKPRMPRIQKSSLVEWTRPWWLAAETSMHRELVTHPAWTKALTAVVGTPTRSWRSGAAGVGMLSEAQNEALRFDIQECLAPLGGGVTCASIPSIARGSWRRTDAVCRLLPCAA